MGTHMRLSYLLLLLALEARAQGAPKIELLPAPKAPEDYEHQFKGCLENSECDQVMGHQLSRWNELVKKLKLPEMEEKERVRYLELFRAKYGIPVEFYTVQKSQQGFKPLLFNSSCREHNPKSGAKILRGTAFLKGLSHEKAVVWRDQTQIEVPIGELLTPQPVVAYRDAAIARYELPLGDQPLFIRNNHLYVLREADDLFYFLTVSEAGDWKIEQVDMERLSAWELKRTEVPCPKDAGAPAPKLFGTSFCKTVWDEDLKKSVTVKLHQGCVI
jgi:hypothetical protein